MILYQVFDPYIQMGTTIATHPDKASVEADMAEHLRYWDGMTEPGGEFPEGTVVTLNTDHPDDPSVYFLTITYPEAYAAESGNPVHQTDVFFVLRDDPYSEIDDLSEINAAQCRDCGRVNVVPATWDGRGYLPEGTRPVWRQAADGAHMLCDPCADAEQNRASAAWIATVARP